MKNDFQIKVIFGFNTPNYQKLISRLGESRKINIGYDIYPYSINMSSDDVSKLRKFDSIYGKITYVTGFLYLEDLISCSMNSMIEDKRPYNNNMIWDVFIGEEL
jgi:hypothetical protein